MAIGILRPPNIITSCKVTAVNPSIKGTAD